MRRRDEWVDPAEAERLDRALDGHTAVPLWASPPHRDRGLSQFSEQFRMLDAQDVEPEPNAAFVRRLEDNLMLHARDTHPSFDRTMGSAPLPENQWAEQPRPLPAPSRRVRTWASQSLSWMATAAILALVAASAFVAYIAAPGSGDDKPAQLGALQSATPGTGNPTGDAVHPDFLACEVEPRTLDEVIVLLQWDPLGIGASDRPPAVPPAVPEPVIPNPYSLDATWKLPDGSAPGTDAVEGIVATYGQLWGCNFDQDQLRGLALYSDAGVVREFYPDGTPNIGRIAYLSTPRDEQVLENRPKVGDPIPRTLYGFRVLMDGRIGVYSVAEGTVPSADHPNRQGSGEGYLVFVEQDGRWLVDESMFVSG